MSGFRSTPPTPRASPPPNFLPSHAHALTRLVSMSDKKTIRKRFRFTIHQEDGSTTDIATDSEEERLVWIARLKEIGVHHKGEGMGRMGRGRVGSEGEVEGGGWRWRAWSYPTSTQLSSPSSTPPYSPTPPKLHRDSAPDMLREIRSASVENLAGAGAGEKRVSMPPRPSDAPSEPEEAAVASGGDVNEYGRVNSSVMNADWMNEPDEILEEISDEEEVEDEPEHVFPLTVEFHQRDGKDHRRLLLAADSPFEQEDWLRCLSEAVNPPADPYHSHVKPTRSVMGCAMGCRLRETGNGKRGRCVSFNLRTNETMNQRNHSSPPSTPPPRDPDLVTT